MVCESGLCGLRVTEFSLFKNSQSGVVIGTIESSQLSQQSVELSDILSLLGILDSHFRHLKLQKFQIC